MYRPEQQVTFGFSHNVMSFDFSVLYLHGWCYQYNVSTRNPKTHYVTGKPEDYLLRSKHAMLKSIYYYYYYTYYIYMQ